MSSQSDSTSSSTAACGSSASPTAMTSARCIRASRPASTALGLLGPSGMAAYFGLLDLAGLRAGETVLVSAAANVAGAMAGQVAMIKGARAIGIGSSREKCDWATRHARFAAMRQPSCGESRARVCSQLAPQGFDVYFDNSGGELLEAVLSGHHLAPGGRVVLNSVREDDPAELLRRAGYAPGEITCAAAARRGITSTGAASS